MNGKLLVEETQPFRQFLQQQDHYLYHTFAYKKFVEEAFGVRYEFWMVYKDQTPLLLLPLVPVNSYLFGKRLISSAYIEYGGYVGSPGSLSQLIKGLKKTYPKYQYLEIRDNIVAKKNYAKMTSSTVYKRVVLPLPNKELVWSKIQKSKRKAVKKSAASILTKDVPKSDLDQLYALYLKNMRAFGSPPYGKRYFKAFYRHLVDVSLAKVFGAYYQGKLVAALLGFCYGDRVHILIAVSDSKYQQYRPNDALHWAFISWACDNGYAYFDFGRVRQDSGQFTYKLKWGGQVQDLPSHFLLWNTDKIPVVDPTSSKYQLLTKVWKKLPLPVTQVLGHRLRTAMGI